MSDKRCELCGKRPASVRFTEIAATQVTKRFICRACAEARGLLAVPVEPVVALQELLAASQPAAAIEVELPGLACGACGLDVAQFRKTGRLGCAACYAAFESELVPLLRRIHAHTRHAGKAPRRSARRVEFRRRVDALRQDLERAVRTEDYERAASLRDQIRQLEHEQGVAARRAAQAAVDPPGAAETGGGLGG